MNGFECAQQVEALARQELLPWLLAACGPDGVEETDFSPFLQKVWGDYVVNRDGIESSLELKAEWDFTGNLFLEMFSNMKWGTPGWMLTCRADWLLYFFGCNGRLYIMSLHQLRAWAFAVNENTNRQRLDGYALKKQGKYDQLNDTWGRCVPIVDIQAGINVTLLTRLDRERLSEREASLEHNHLDIPF